MCVCIYAAWAYAKWLKGPPEGAHTPALLGYTYVYVYVYVYTFVYVYVYIYIHTFVYIYIYTYVYIYICIYMCIYIEGERCTCILYGYKNMR